MSTSGWMGYSSKADCTEGAFLSEELGSIASLEREREREQNCALRVCKTVEAAAASIEVLLAQY